MRYALGSVLLAAGYLCGSVSFAILVTRLRTGKDIRTLGNANPGTANVARTLGRGWGALVLLGDVLKALLPMLAARRLCFRGEGWADILMVFAVGLAAVVGHCYPLFHGFRGGGGVAASLPVLGFFTPVEFLASLLLAFLIVQLFVKRSLPFRLGRWVPMIAGPIVPVLVAAVNALVSVPLGAGISIGGHPRAVPVGVLATSTAVILLNVPKIRESLAQAKGARSSGPGAGRPPGA